MKAKVIRLMIGEDGELATLNVVTEVFYHEEDAQQFMIKHAVLLLSIGEFPVKENHREPDAVEKLLELTTDCPVRGIH